MASAFKLFGEIDVKTQSFQGALRDLDARLKSTAGALSDTENKAKSLGNITATSARGFEKLGTKITSSRADLDTLSKAFDKGDISAKKYATGLLSIDKAAQNASSKIKDLNAKLADQNTRLTSQNTRRAEQEAKRVQSASDKEARVFQRTLDDLDKRLRDLPNKSVGLEKIQEIRSGLRETFSSASVGATQAADKARALYTELKNIGTAASMTTRPASLKALGDEAKRVQGEIDALDAKIQRVTSARQASAARSALTAEQKYGRINLARQGADVFTQLGSGQSLGIVAIQQGPQILEAMAQSGLKASTAIAAISTAFLATAGAAAAAGAVVIAITKQIREQAEKRTEAEFKLQAAINKGIIDQKKALDLAIKTREEEAKSRKFNRDIADNEDLANLRLKQENLIKRRDIGTPEQVVDFNEQIKALDRRIEEIQAARAAAQKEAFEQNWENWKKSQEDAVEAAKKAFEDYNKTLEETNQKLDEMQKNALSALDEIGSRQDNPILQAMLEAEKAVARVTEATKGFSKTIVDSMTAAVSKANNLAMAAVKIANAVGIMDSQISAASLRAPTRNELLTKFSRDWAGSTIGMAGGTTNPDVLNQFNKQLAAAENADAIQRASEMQQRIAGLKNLQYQFRGDSAQQALVDKQIQGLASQFSKDELGPDNREFVAQAFDRDVTRKAELDTAAKEFYEGKSGLGKEIADFIKDQKEKAKNSKDGKIQIEVTDANGRVENVTNGSPNDVRLTYGSLALGGLQ